MPRGAHNRFCPLSMALEVLGDPWSLLVVRALLAGPRGRPSLCVFLAGLDDAALDDVLEGLLKAGIIGSDDGGPPSVDGTYELTDRGASLAPVVQALTRWGLSDMLLTEPGSQVHQDQESFDQTWTIADLADRTDEVYAWTINGKTFGLEVVGTTLTRTIGHPSAPVAALETSSDVFDALVFGELGLSEALMRGDLKLTGTPASIRRMFHVVGFPPELVDAILTP